MINIGWKKAVEFLGTLKKDESGLDVLRALGKSARKNANGAELSAKTKCTVCRHPGNKQLCKKNGCPTCKTQPGEPCIPYSDENRVRDVLIEKITMTIGGGGGGRGGGGGGGGGGGVASFPDEKLISFYSSTSSWKVEGIELARQMQAKGPKSPALKSILYSNVQVFGRNSCESPPLSAKRDGSMCLTFSPFLLLVQQATLSKSSRLSRS